MLFKIRYHYAAIIYGAVSGSPRRVVSETYRFDELAAATVLSPGEDIVFISPSEIKWLRWGDKLIPELQSTRARVAKKIGRWPMDARCVVLGDDLDVVALLEGDPLLDRDSRGLVVREPDALLGDRLMPDGRFYRVYGGGWTPIDEVHREPIRELRSRRASSNGPVRQVA